MALPASDNFNRADASPIGANWTYASDLNYLRIVSNAAQAEAAGDACSYWTADAFAANQWSECKITTANDGGPAVRCSSSGCYYWTTYSDGEIWRYKTGGAWTKIGEANTTVTSSDVIRLEATGTTTTTLKLYKNGALVATVTDSSSPLTSGSAGLYSVGATILDDWQGDVVSTVTIAYRNVGQVNAAFGTSVTCPLPTGVSDGDLLLLQVATTGTINAPAGWTLLLSGAKGNIYKRTASNEPASYDVTTTATAWLSAAIVAFYATPAATINVDDAQVQDNASGAYVCPSVTVANANGAVAAFLCVQAALTVTPDAALTERYDYSTSRSRWCGTRDNVAAGATGTYTGSKAGGSDGAGSGYTVAMSAATEANPPRHSAALDSLFVY
jgi:hypothetical protein